MSDQLVEALRDEAARLRQRLSKIEALLAEYGGESLSVPRPRHRSRPPPPTQSAKGESAMKEARIVVSKAKGEPVSTRKILDHLIENSIHIGGKRPVATLSAMLSNSDEFENKDRQGWVLVSKDEAPDDVSSASAGEGGSSPESRQAGGLPFTHRP